MKTKILFAAAAALTLFASCSKDGESDKTPPVGEQSLISLTIYDATAAGKSRAAVDETDNPTPAESAIDVSQGIKVVVFNEDGSLAYPLGSDPVKLTLTAVDAANGKYESSAFSVNAGQKYFYIFANDANNVITQPGAGMTRAQFIARTTAASLNSSDVLNLTDGNFLMGTLWSEKKLAPGGGSAADPERVALTIGRLASKVTLAGVSQGTNGTMAGTFSQPKYRLGSIPNTLYVVGNNDETHAAPPALGHGVVTSAVHTAAHDSGNYQEFTNTWKAAGANFYTVENTTAPVSGIQYYGNTTFIQIETVYTPAVSEVYEPDLTPAGSFTGPSFYTARKLSSGDILIFEKDPRTEAGNNPDADIDQSSIAYYENGLNYHKFPIYDPETGLPEVQKNAVLRNHSYIYTVKNILSLGSHEKEVPPVEPIETPTTIELDVQVSPWSKIEDDDVTIG